jgi:hypothetical protein
MKANEAGLGNLDNGVKKAIIHGLRTGSAVDFFHKKAISVLPNDDQSKVLKSINDFIDHQDISPKYTRNEDARLTLDWILSEAKRV